MEQENNKIRYLAYCRKSTEGKEKQALSIETQKDKISEFSGDLDIIEILEEKHSAFHPYGRPVFSSMVERIKNGEAQGIITWHPDRLSRNEIDAGTLTYMIRKGEIQDLKFGSYSFDNSPEGIWMLQMALSQSQYSSAKNSKDTKRGLEKKARMGWLPGKPTVGYLNNKYKEKGKKDIIKDPKTFDLIKKLWEMLLTGKYPIKKLYEMATSEWNLAINNRSQMSRSKFYEIFKNPFYCGHFYYGGTFYKGSHEPMISEDKFNLAQKIIGNRSKSPFNTHTFAYTGLMRCGECGASITAEHKIKRQKNGNVHYYTYYRCTKRLNSNCTQRTIRLENLEMQILSILNDIQIPTEFYDWAMDCIKQDNEKGAENRNKVLKNQQKEYNDCVKEIDGLISMRAKGEIDEENYKRKMDFLLNKKTRLYALLHNTDNQINEGVKRIEKAFDFAKNAKFNFEKGTLEDRRRVLAELGSNLLLKDRKLSVSIEKPLIFVGQAAPIARQLKSQLEPIETDENRAKLFDLYSKNAFLGQKWDTQK